MLARQKNLAAKLGEKGRLVAEEEFSEHRFDEELSIFFNNLLCEIG